MDNAEVSDLELFVSFGAETLHFTQRHLVVCFVNEIKSSLALGPFTRVTVERDGRSTFRKHDTPRHLAHVDRLCRQLKKIVWTTIIATATTNRRKHRELVIFFQKRIRCGVLLIHRKQQRASETFELPESSNQILKSTRDCRRSIE